jgi:protein TonB
MRLTLSHPYPGYPPGARRVEGSGVFLLHIDTRTGNVNTVEVQKSTGHRVLDIEAIKALRRWRFRPGIPYELIRLPVTFAGW